MDDALRDLLDREAIRDACSVADRIDAGRFDELRAMFVADARANLLGHRVLGRDAIVAHMADSLARYRVTSHHVSNQMVSVMGDAAAQDATVYAFHRSRKGAVWHFFGRYELELMRTSDGWRMTSLTLHGLDGLPDDPALTPLYTGHPDRETP